MATIYIKTAAGQHEIETRARRLTPRARSLLILIDGKRTDDELATLVQRLDEAMPALLEAGLVEIAFSEAARPVRPKPVGSPAGVASESTEDTAALRRSAVRAVIDLLGPNGEPLALRLEKAADGIELTAALERAVAAIANMRGGAAAVQFANRFLKSPGG